MGNSGVVWQSGVVWEGRGVKVICCKVTKMNEW